MKPLMLLAIVFGITAAISKIITGHWNWIFSGNLAMFAMLSLTSLGHFKFTQGMTMMMPEFIPFKRELVYFTGIAEILIGLSLLIPQFRYYAGIVLVLLLVLMLPANINAAIKRVDFEKATLEGNGVNYLWFRVPLQLFFIGWVVYFSIKS